MSIPFKNTTRRRMHQGVKLCLVLLFAATHCYGQGYQRHNPTADLAIHLSANTVHKAPKKAFNFREEAKRQGIATRKVSAFTQQLNGYYLVAGVFGDARNANRFMGKLKSAGLNPTILQHPENKLNYITLSYSSAPEPALGAAVSKLGGGYQGDIWIMEVINGKSVTAHKQETADKPATNSNTIKEEQGFLEAARAYNIPARSVSIPQLNPGYYLIAGVFGELNNANAFSGQLHSKQLQAATFYNPLKQAHYVHLGHFSNWQEAIAMGHSQLQGRYQNQLWILEVRKGETANIPVGINEVLDEDLLKKPALVAPLKHAYIPALKTGSLVKDPPGLLKLIEKADGYFDKLWYAEAAELYELAIEKMQSPSFEVIRKAGDSHYFNTNMERAYYWYEKLFDDHKEEMSSENLFKYAHALKGTGRYGRAKRLMRLYDRKMETENSSIPAVRNRPDTREAILDNILSTEEQVAIKNLEINSKYSDFAPMFFEKDKMVFASSVDSAFFSTRRYKWNNQPYLDLYVARLNEESEDFHSAVKFSKKVNTKYHEAGVTFSPDNNTMYFTRNNYGKKLKRDKNGINHLKIYRSVKVDGDWTEAEELSFNSDTYSTGHPALSPDGKQLYFVSDMPGSIGDTDIFVVDVLGEGSFSEPRNLGPEINTEGKEMFPFINDHKLYFSSDGHAGLGGLDVFEVAFSEEDGFLEVRNLGRPINSNKDDFSYIVNEETQKGYFASNRRGGKGDDDIYSFKRLLVEEANKNAIEGVVTDLVSGEVLPEALVLLLDENNRKLKEIITGDDGAFVFEDLEGNTKYILKTHKIAFDTHQQDITTTENETLSVDIALQRLDERIVVENGVKKLKTDMIYFDFDKSYIRPDAATELDKLVAVMREYPQMVIAIESHTDSRGPATYNKYLSDRRAKSTREYLITQGISAERIQSATGYGEEQLLNECNGSVRCSEAKHQLNRRSEFIIVKM